MLSVAFASCSKSRDCECTTKGGDEKSSVRIDDYEGSCSELNEEEATCKEV